MRKVILAVALALSLGACAELKNIQGAIGVATVGVTNPIDKTELYNFENGLVVAFAGLNAYRRSCLAGAVDTNCKANIRAMQVYTRQIPPVLSTVRAFVKQNDLVNAQIAFNTAKQLYANFVAIATSNGVKVQ